MGHWLTEYLDKWKLKRETRNMRTNREAQQTSFNVQQIQVAPLLRVRRCCRWWATTILYSSKFGSVYYLELFTPSGEGQLSPSLRNEGPLHCTASVPVTSFPAYTLDGHISVRHRSPGSAISHPSSWKSRVQANENLNQNGAGYYFVF